MSTHLMSRRYRSLVLIALFLISGRQAFAADLSGLKEPSITTTLPTFTWTGFYVGVNAGYVVDRSSISGKTGLFEPYLGGQTYGGYNVSDGFTGGGQIGYNYQFGAGSGVVVGLESDFDYTDISRDRSTAISAGPFSGVTDHYRTSLDGIGTIRGRLGYGFGPLLAYGTGGFAYGIADRQAALTAPGNATLMRLDLKDLDTGYVLGGGIEYALPKRFAPVFIGSGNFTVKAEYLHADMGQDAVPLTISGQSFTAHLHSAVDLARAGINYKF